MKRLWIGLCVLGLLLGLGLLTAWGMDRVLEPVSRLLSQASRAALEENWSAADALAADAAARWDALRPVAAAAADHAPLEQMDALFAQLRVYGRERDSVHFAACCSQLAALTDSVSEAHSVSWQNLL